MYHFCLVALLAVLCTVAVSSAFAAGPLQGGVDFARANEIATLLPEAPVPFGPTITDRTNWDRIAQHDAFKTIIEQAERRLSQSTRPMTEEVYSQFAKTGQRTKEYAEVRSNRHNRVTLYALAECVENKGRFVKPLEDAIADICAEPTWILNFHDSQKLEDWNGKRMTIDLGSSVLAGDIAQAMLLLGDRLSPQTRELIKSNCRRRILDPYVKAIENGGGQWWIVSDMNWNSVCHNGVLGTALAVVDDRNERAWFIASAEKYTRIYLGGFGPDGYCSEGMGYWGYGFGHYTEMSEQVLRATGGKLSLLDQPAARAAAMFPTNLEIQQGIFPAYADCGLNAQPPARLSSFLAQHYRIPLTRGTMTDLTAREGGLCTTLMYCFPRSGMLAVAAQPAAAPAPLLRSLFDHGGVLACRPANPSDTSMAVSLKGGHNAEGHNHNDLGTFVVVIGNELLILDPGGETYTARTFSKDRYKSNLLNSFGHPVPVVAGQFQREGKEAAAKILKTDFTDARDIFEVDLTSAYPVPELKGLTREFTYDRTSGGSLTVLDSVSYSSPQSFATALITYSQVEVQPDNTIVIRGKSAAASVTIDAGGAAYDIAQQVIEEENNTKTHATRIGINLREPLLIGKVKLTIRPVATK